MTEYNKMAKGSFTATGPSKFITLPFQPDYVEVLNYTNFQAAAPTNVVTRAIWDKNLIVGITNPTLIEGYAGVAAFRTGVIETGGISSFQAALQFQFGAQQQIVASTKGNPTSFQVTAHGFQTGDVVMFQGLYSTQFTAGMPQMDGMLFTVTVVDANNFTVFWDSTGTNYTALAASPLGAFVKKVLYPDLYIPGVTFINAITLGATTTIHTTSPHNCVVGQQVAFRITAPWHTTQLNSLPNNIIPGSPIYGYIVAITDAFTVIVNIDSTAFTAFFVDIPVDEVAGLTFPQMVPVGDVNTGGWPISPGSPLYPSPFVNFNGTTGAYRTINGPAVQGAFVNNTRQGFVIGAGLVTLPAATFTTTTIMATGNIILWRAFFHDISIP